MKIIYTKSFDNTFKKLKKHSKEIKLLNQLITDLQNIPSFKELEHDNYFMIYYNFERLKHYKNIFFYSFNLSKKGGVIRLIVEPISDNIVFLYISLDHYKDFNERKVIYYE